MVAAHARWPQDKPTQHPVPAQFSKVDVVVRLSAQPLRRKLALLFICVLGVWLRYCQRVSSAYRRRNDLLRRRYALNQPREWVYNGFARGVSHVDEGRPSPWRCAPAVRNRNLPLAPPSREGEDECSGFYPSLEGRAGRGSYLAPPRPLANWRAWKGDPPGLPAFQVFTPLTHWRTWKVEAWRLGVPSG